MISLDFTTINIIFAIAIVFVFLILLASKKQKPGKTKEELYACGEKINAEEMQPQAETLFWPILKAFKPFYKYIAKKHTGDLSDYLSWILIALVLIFLALIGVYL